MRFWDLRFGIFLGFGIWVLGFSLLTGCTSQTKAREQAKAAFMAGQQSAMMRMAQPQKPVVTFIGQVQVPSVPWTEGLTLAQAIVSAGYMGRDPKQIVIVRNGPRSAPEARTGPDQTRHLRRRPDDAAVHLCR